MTEWLLAALADYGVTLLFFATLASCLALPVPSSLLMLSGGAFVASGDLSATAVVGGALAGALVGDQAGYFLGQSGKAQLNRALTSRPRRAALMARARKMTDRWGGVSVFLSRWLVSPLGPYVNFAGGAAGQNWLTFTFWGAMGEMVWVTAYVGLGYGFANNIEMAADLAGNVLGLLSALAVVAGSAWWLVHHGREHAHSTQ